MEQKITKPVTLIRQELIENLTNEINDCKLPMFVIESILQDLLSAVRTAAQQQYEADKKQYERQLQEQNEDKKE